MLQLTNGSIVEMPITTVTKAVNLDSAGCVPTFAIGGCAPFTDWGHSYYTVWNSYPVYVCTDKTAKAIEILKTLQAEKLIECKSIPEFIELIEKISGLL